MPTWIKILGIILFAVLIIVFIAWFSNRKIVAKADEFLSYISKGDMVSAYGLMHQNAKEITNMESFEAVAKDFFYRSKTSESLYIKSTLWLNRSVKTEGGKTFGMLKGRITLADESKVEIEMQLKKDGGIWYINYFVVEPIVPEEFTKETVAIGQLFLNELFNGDQESAYKLMHSKFLNMKGSSEAFAESLKPVLESGLKFVSVELKAREVNDKENGLFGILKGDVVFEGDQVVPVEFVLRKDESQANAWRITAVTFADK